jgi:hypothetical protein
MREGRLLAAGVRLLFRLEQNLLWGVGWGLGVGAGFCLLGVVLRAVRGPKFLHPYGITFGTLILVYLAGGAGAGAVLGLGRPLTRWRAGAIVIGIIGGMIAYGAAGIALEGPIGRWSAGEWLILALLGSIGGGILGNRMWERYVEPTLSRPPLPPGPPPPPPPLGLWRPR